jgi:hypothetical protein
MAAHSEHQRYLRKLAASTARERLGKARQAVRDARLAKREAHGRATQACRSARLTLREWSATERARVKAAIARLREELRSGLEERRAKVRECCGADRAKVREAATAHVTRTRAQLAELMDERRRERIWSGQATKGTRSRHRVTTAAEQKAESDHEVEVNLSPDQLLVWRQMKDRIQPSARRSRTEVFLEWLAENGPDVARILEAEAEAAYKQALRDETQARKDAKAIPKARESRLRQYLATTRQRGALAGLSDLAPTDKRPRVKASKLKRAEHSGDMKRRRKPKAPKAHPQPAPAEGPRASLADEAHARSRAGETVHPFELAGLGRAPFKWGGVTEKVFQSAPGEPVKGAGSCDYCGQGIRYQVEILSADGKRFKVGTDCAARVGGNGIRKRAETWERTHAKQLGKTRKSKKAEQATAEHAELLAQLDELAETSLDAFAQSFAPSLARQIRAGKAPTPKQLAAFAKLRNERGLSRAAIPKAPQLDLDAFARKVQQLADTSPDVARFYDDRSFIASVYDAGSWAETLDQFKARLVEAHRAGKLRLTRADLVGAMDPTLVERSETGYLSATFHFVVNEPVPEPVTTRREPEREPEQVTAARDWLYLRRVSDGQGGWHYLYEVTPRKPTRPIKVKHGDFTLEWDPKEETGFLYNWKNERYYLKNETSIPEESGVHIVDKALKSYEEPKHWGAARESYVGPLNMTPRQFLEAARNALRHGRNPQHYRPREVLAATFKDGNRWGYFTSTPDGVYGARYRADFGTPETWETQREATSAAMLAADVWSTRLKLPRARAPKNYPNEKAATDALHARRDYDAQPYQLSDSRDHGQERGHRAHHGVPEGEPAPRPEPRETKPRKPREKAVRVTAQQLRAMRWLRAGHTATVKDFGRGYLALKTARYINPDDLQDVKLTEGGLRYLDEEDERELIRTAKAEESQRPTRDSEPVPF